MVLSVRLKLIVGLIGATLLNAAIPVDEPARAFERLLVDDPGIKVAMEILPSGTFQDKSMTLAAAGTPVFVSYTGSRTLNKLASEGLIVPAGIPAEMEGSYQPGVLKAVSYDNKYVGVGGGEITSLASGSFVLPDAISLFQDGHEDRYGDT